MKVCIPIKNQNNFQIFNDINNTPNIMIFDTTINNFYVKDTSKMNLGQIIDYLLENNVKRLISNVKISYHNKYISCKDIVIYIPNYEFDALYNINLFILNKLKVDKTKH